MRFTIMGFFSFLAPKSPPLDDELGFVQWFFKYDGKISNEVSVVRSADSFITDYAKSLVRALSNDLRNTNAEELVKSLTYNEATLQVHLESIHHKQESQQDDKKLKFILLHYASTVISMRIRGYYLLKKYGIDPDSKLPVQDV